MKSCATCRWFKCDFYDPADKPGDELGFCEWPSSRLPYSLRWGGRERMMVSGKDGSECSCHEPKEGK